MARRPDGVRMRSRPAATATCCLVVVLVALVAGCTSPSAAPDSVASSPATSRSTPSTVTDPSAEGPTPVARATGDPQGATTAPEPTGDASGPVTVGRFAVAVVPEASGLAVSRRNPDVAWVLDDGPGTAGLVAVPLTTDGATAPPASDDAAITVAVEGLEGVDTEALAVGDCAADDPRSCVFIGDIGDNRRSRDAVRVHRFVEPDLSDGMPQEPLPADSVTLTYPGGPTDAEAMFALDGRLFIVSKAPFDAGTGETGATRLYELPRFGDGALEPRGEVPVPLPSLSLAAGLVGNVVTGADATDGAVVLRTYDHAVRYTAPASGADIASFPTWPFEEVPTAGPLQTEAIAFDTGACATLTAGEGSGFIWRVPC